MKTCTTGRGTPWRGSTRHRPWMWSASKHGGKTMCGGRDWTCEPRGLTIRLPPIVWNFLFFHLSVQWPQLDGCSFSYLLRADPFLFSSLFPSPHSPPFACQRQRLPQLRPRPCLPNNPKISMLSLLLYVANEIRTTCPPPTIDCILSNKFY